MNVHAKLSIALLFALSAVSALAGDFYVSPDGNDANPGSEDKPFATLTRARDAVRQAKKQAKEPFNVLIRGGTYAVTEPLVLGPGGWGIDLSLGCQDNAICGNHLYDLGAGAVRVGSPDICFHDAEETCRTVISDNTIHDGTSVYMGAPAIWIGQSSGNRVAHNEIYGPFEWAISVGWNWGYMPPNRARDNVVEYNHVHHLGLSPLGTHGALYFLGVSPGTAARYNLIHHIAGGGSGSVLDNASVGIVVEYNVVPHAEYSSLMCNHNDLGNIVQNNVFALAAKSQLHRIGDIPADKSLVHQTGVFYRNVFYWKNARLFERDDWIDYDILMDYNLYFDAGGAPVKFCAFNFDEWKKKKLDLHSIVADPFFLRIPRTATSR